MTLLGEALLDGVTHLLLEDVDMVIVQHQVADKILNKSSSSCQQIRLVCLKNLSHQPLWQLIFALLQPLLNTRSEVRHSRGFLPVVAVRVPPHVRPRPRPHVLVIVFKTVRPLVGVMGVTGPLSAGTGGSRAVGRHLGNLVLDTDTTSTVTVTVVPLVTYLD